MKIISLNTFAGTVFEPLMTFIEEQAATTDVFCFQEITSAQNTSMIQAPDGKRADLLQQIAKRLPGWQSWFAPIQVDYEHQPDDQGHVVLGLAIFAKDHIHVTKNGEFFLFGGYNTYVRGDNTTLGRSATFIQLQLNGIPLTICTVHGIADPGEKLDTPERLAQSQKIVDFIQSQPGEKIVMGDFNLYPDTESIRMIERAGFRNLIKEYGITETRGTMMRKLHPKYGIPPSEFQHFADFTFVTPGIRIQRFEVPDAPVSDHLPMIVEIEM